MTMGYHGTITTTSFGYGGPRSCDETYPSVVENCTPQVGCTLHGSPWIWQKRASNNMKPSFLGFSWLFGSSLLSCFSSEGCLVSSKTIKRLWVSEKTDNARETVGCWGPSHVEMTTHSQVFPKELRWCPDVHRDRPQPCASAERLAAAGSIRGAFETSMQPGLGSCGVLNSFKYP